nr:espin-like protein [Nothobranchius furzeri]
MSADAWKFSLAHSGILGPFGELLTEEDLVYLQQQIESVSLQKRCQAYELELTRLTEELRAILPGPIVNISLNKDILQQMDSEGKLNLTMPVWCSRISEMITNMSLLVSNLTQTTENERDWRMVEGVVEEMKGLQGIKNISGGGLGQRLVPQGQEMESMSVETSSGCRMPHIGIASAFSQRVENDSYSRARRERVEREIQQSGVSVRNLRSNFEGQIGEVYPVAGVVQVERELKGKKKVEDSRRSSSKIGYLSQEASNECVPVYDTKGLRKERIVVLFLSHWKKSAYAISVRAANQRQNAASGKTAAQSQKSTSLLQLCLQRGAVAKTLNSWRSKLKDAQSHLTQHPRPRVTYSPEHFLPDANGVTMSHDSLTLDLFMLGYFHILEQDLSAEERKMRHLLCFEVFDHVGSFPWEKVRDFHKAVLQEIQSGRKQWSDGFEDLKTHFFGEPKPCSCPLSSSLLMPESKSLPKVIIQGASPEESSNDTDFSCFNNEDICKYIDRSFAFWKEKEAELFDFDH